MNHNQNIRARTSASEETQQQQKPEPDGRRAEEERDNLEPQFIHSTEFKWFIVVCLLLTTAAGTYRSFSIYSRAIPEQPIHQITRIPSSSLISTQAIDLKSLPYFAQKSNFFNQKFVKLGWAWTSFVVWFHSIALASFYFGSTTDQQHASNNPPRSNGPAGKHPSTHVPRIISLHLIASFLWIFLTQWFFGSSLMERFLVLSGAKCIPSPNLQSSAEQSNVLESIYCEQRWGKRMPGLDPVTISTYRPYWSGGIDVSGHTFLLSFSIMIILSALQPSLVHLFKKDTVREKIPTSYRVAIYVNLGLLILWWWMLLMTSLYFHGPSEKLFGLALGVGSWFFVESLVDKFLA